MNGCLQGAHSASLTGRRFQSPASPPTARVLTFGFASAVQQQPPPVRTKSRSTESPSSSCYDEESPSTSTPEHTHQVIINAEPDAADFFLRLPDNQVIPLFCHCPSGAEADAFLQSLPERQRERMRGFLEIEKPEAGEFHIWIQEGESGEVSTHLPSIHLPSLALDYCDLAEGTGESLEERESETSQMAPLVQGKR